MADKDLTYRQATRIVLTGLNEGMKLPEIETEILRQGLRHKVVSSSLRSVLDTDYQFGKKNHGNSEFIRCGYGKYKVNPDILPKDSINSRKNEILIIKEQELENLGYFYGINKDFSIYREKFLSTPIPLFEERGKAENEKNNRKYKGNKQIVSYIIVKYRDLLLSFHRKSQKVNKCYQYVDGEYSIGFGGHVQLTDYTLFSNTGGDSSYLSSVYRELSEETGITQDEIEEVKFIGVLNDDSTPRGENHFAFIHLVSLNHMAGRTMEKSVKEVKFISFDDISEKFAKFEYWSKICLQTYFSNKLAKECYFEKNNIFSLYDNPKYLAIVGGIATGKSAICSILEKKDKYIHIPCSQIFVNNLLFKEGLSKERREIQKAGYKFINSPHAHEIFAKQIIKYISQYGPKSRFIFDGLRYKETLIELRRLLKAKIPVIFVETPIETRYKNYLFREKSSISYKEFLDIIFDPVERNIEKFVPMTNIFIYNNGPINSLPSEISEFFEEELTESFLIKPWDINAKARHFQLLRKKDLTFFELNFPQIMLKIESHPKYPNISVLDVGCGSGILTKMISEKVTNVIGIDPSAESILIAKGYAVSKNIDFYCSTAEEFSTENQFDVAIANMTLHAVKNLRQAILNTFNLMKSGGLFVFTIPHPRYYPRRENHKGIFLEEGYDYHQPHYYEMDFSITLEPQPLPSPTPYFHRPWEVYQDIFDESGFIEVITQPLFPEAAIMKLYGKEWTYPHILLSVYKKP